MKKLASILVFVVAVGALACTCHAETVTPEKMIETAESLSGKGGTIEIKGGEYSPESSESTVYYFSDIHGKKNSPIVITSAGGTASWNGKALADSEERIMFEFDNCSDIKISGLKICGMTAGKSVQAILIENGSKNITVENCEISDINVKDPATADHCGNAVLVLNESKKVSKGINIIGNSIHDCATGWSEAVSIEGNCKKVTVKNNTLRDIGNIGIDMAGGYGTCPSKSADIVRNSVIEGNDVSGCSSAYGDTAYGIYVDGAKSITIKDNTVTGCDGGIEIGAEQPSAIAKSIKVVNNIIRNNSRNELTIGGYTNDSSTGYVRKVKVTGNTIEAEGDCASEAVLTLSKCSSVSFIGNKFKNSTSHTGIDVPFGSEFTKNIRWKDNSYEGNIEQP
ncbi:MAG: right-handed parallel beta-helix repeat-containing protein [Lachnospiraceae bacterium]|nr:right-handed parallel beta-helix repeat-containing protein [Lachnospiraceae bacterium]